MSKRQPVTSWGGLLRRMATHRAIDRLRDRYRQAGRLETVAVESLVGHVGEAETASQVQELIDQLRLEVARLPQQQGEAFWLHCIEQVPYEDIGEQMKIQPSHARVLVHRARVHLRGALDVEPQFSSSKVDRL